MSAEGDVRQMKEWCWEIADHYRSGPSMQESVTAVMKQVGVGANRAYEFLKARARRVDGWEKDAARAALKRIEEAKDAAFYARLGTTVAKLKAVDPEFYRADIAQLERVLSQARLLDRAGTETQGTGTGGE